MDKFTKFCRDGWDRILDGEGLPIAGVGMFVVFLALVLISVFIANLPRILALVARVMPEKDEAETKKTAAMDESLVAAIGFVLHEREQGR